MVNYENGRIYKIVCINDIDENDVYIGSTAEPTLSKRMERHRATYRSWLLGNIKKKLTSYNIFEKYGVENCQIVLIELFPCSCKDELQAKEAFYIKTIKCVNKLIPREKNYTDSIEYKDETKIKKNLYRQLNKDKIRISNKIYRDNNKEKALIYNKSYRIEKKNEISEQKKLSYQINKEKIAIKRKETYQIKKDQILEKQKLKRQLKKNNDL